MLHLYYIPYNFPKVKKHYLGVCFAVERLLTALLQAVIVLPLRPKHPRPYTYPRALLPRSDPPGAAGAQTAEAQQNPGKKVPGLSAERPGTMLCSRLFLHKSEKKRKRLRANCAGSSKCVCPLPRGGKHETNFKNKRVSAVCQHA